jgi:hypothetical protein
MSNPSILRWWRLEQDAAARLTVADLKPDAD